MVKKELFFLNVLEFIDDYKIKKDPAEMYNYCFSSEKDMNDKISEMIYDYCDDNSIFVDKSLNIKILEKWYQENIFGQYTEKPFKYESYKMNIYLENGEIYHENEYF